ncbi:hypothetical protein SEA_TRAAWW1_4 [Mycobacterium phage Traaww1]|uniref:Uncharacterized protein n=1 Tax=Mycobacterium phage Stank TaxID=3136629 RepID=A0AAU8GNZ9_9VIRU|nr:hypothetical protein DRDREY_5 [Mycobacterium phage DrDrey]AVI03254.1 hypothetical protein SEA_ASRIEL_4 [Mycobacterium phage Asriel]AVI03395.1 hypothetical protein SEA_BARBARIAN_4 [Mycobacterium phage Barbarian]AXH48639.1 hypothetical protein SEA_SHEREKHAN_5 [Mycobacterium phage ShereKhan]AXH50540.1 hypothetical protein SEA_SIMPLIPHY_4 [Mycobacterium phage Simpliphy]AYB70218.1 hypothetical protein SEA_PAPERBEATSROCK_5 [Mycobacterium phage Paperbeatsrock]QAY05192.1 hypothetical protein SEA_C
MTAQYPALPPMTAWQKELLAILLVQSARFWDLPDDPLEDLGLWFPELQEEREAALASASILELILQDADLTLTYRRWEAGAVIDALLEGLEDG